MIGHPTSANDEAIIIHFDLFISSTTDITVPFEVSFDAIAI